MSAAKRRKRPKQEYEDPTYAAVCRRMVRALGKRLAKGDPVDLQEFVELQKALDEAMELAVAGQRAQGFSWSDIARGLGVKRQTAWERYRVSSEKALASGAVIAVTVGEHEHDAC